MRTGEGCQALANYRTEDVIFLRERWFKALSDMGPDTFFSSPEEDAKRAREAMAIYFFVAGLQKVKGMHYQVRQPKPDPPDFQLISYGITMPNLENFELVQIPPHFETFQEMMDTVQKKLQHGYTSDYRLLIFCNHEKAREWIKLLNDALEDNPSLAVIYTVSVWQDEAGGYGATVDRLRPRPAKSIRVILGEEKTAGSMLPDYMQGKNIPGGMRVQLAPELLKKLMKLKIGRMHLENNRNQSI